MDDRSGLIIKFLITLLLVFLNGFFVVAEFAIVKVRSSQLEVQNNVNARLAAVAKSIVNNLDAYLAATQLGVTLASLGLGWIGEDVMKSIIMGFFHLIGDILPVNIRMSEATAGKLAAPIGFFILTAFHIVFGELAPKSISINNPLKCTYFVAWPLKCFAWIGHPIIVLMNWMANLVLKLFNIKAVHNADIHSEDELKALITESQEGGAIEETERDLIQNVFDFDDRRVFNIQTLRKNISAIDIQTKVKEALDFAIEEGYSRFPVYEDDLDNIKGVIYTKDLTKNYLEKPEQTSIAPLMRKANFISENAKIKNVLRDFQTTHVQMALVTNEIGELTGVVTIEDILEELVGEIQDEYDNEKPIVVQTTDNIFEVNAHHSISDINKHLPVKLEESEHYETLSGMINELFDDRKLKEGDKLDMGDYEVEILKMYRNSAEDVRLTLKFPESNPDKGDETDH